MLSKKVFIDQKTVIDALFLNNLQDELINAQKLSDKTEQQATQLGANLQSVTKARVLLSGDNMPTNAIVTTGQYQYKLVGNPDPTEGNVIIGKNGYIATIQSIEYDQEGRLVDITVMGTGQQLIEGCIVDVTDDYASLSVADAISYINGLPDGRYYLQDSSGKYYARNVVVSGVHYSEITFYEDDGYIYRYVYIDGLLRETWEGSGYGNAVSVSAQQIAGNTARISDVAKELDSEPLAFDNGVYLVSDGSTVVDPSFATTVAKPVIGGGKVRVKTALKDDACICFYDVKSNLAGFYKPDNIPADGIIDVTLDVPVNAATIRVSTISSFITQAEIRNLDIVREIIRLRQKLDDNWVEIKNNIRLGLGPNLYPVGYEFETPDVDTGNTITWVVRAHDHHTPANSNLTHSMTLEMKYVYSNANGSQKGVQYDAQEALYYAADGLAAGTYHFTVSDQLWYPADNGGSFQFTLAEAVPAGGQVVVSATYNQTFAGKSVKTYASPSSNAVIETATLAAGSGGTSLGTTNGEGNMNHLHRIVLGSNNYAQSAARQWLNSAAAAGRVWAPTNKFDRAPSWAVTYNGFMHSLPADFLAAVESAVIPCRTNSVFECASLDGTEFTVNQVYELKDKFFLLSRPEIYGSWDSATYKDGELLDYYEGLTNAERKKFDKSGSVCNDWLRSPNPTVASSVQIVHTDGNFDNFSSYYSSGVSPACIIA